MRRLAPRPLALALQARQAEWKPDTALAAVQEVWPSAAGAGIAAYASPTAERRGLLTVTCSDAAWAHELDLMGPEIIERLSAALPGVAITRLRCVVSSSD